MQQQLERGSESRTDEEKTTPRYWKKLADFGSKLSKMNTKETESNSPKAKQTSQLETKRSIQELEAGLEKSLRSERNMYDSFATQTEQLEQTKISLEESKQEISRLRLKNLEDVEGLESELEKAKQKLACVHEVEKLSSQNAENLLEEMSLLKNELKSAREAEENDKKAMDDLALALKEVALDCTQVKEKLSSTEAELELSKSEANEFKEKMDTVENHYKTLLMESRKEAEVYKNTAERLRLEAEESLSAWNGKEAVFVDCIKRAEDEKNTALEENNKLLDALCKAETQTKKAKDETQKVRDILKQALNESNAAKEAARIARTENSLLKDNLAKKEDALNFLSEENENLKINEALANEHIKELKGLVSEATDSEDRLQEIETKLKNGKTTNMMSPKQLQAPQSRKNSEEEVRLANHHEDSGEDEDKGSPDSSFDVPETPVPKTHHRQKSSLTSTENPEGQSSVDFDHLDDAQLDDSSSRKKKALLRRFGDLVLRQKKNH